MDLLHVTLLALGIFRWLVDSWKMCALQYVIIIIVQKGVEWVFESNSARVVSICKLGRPCTKG
jgi:hypothetical protein